MHAHASDDRAQCMRCYKKSHTPNDHASKALPLMIAHRAGTKDYPENTLLAINEALKNGADVIWVTVQLSKGGIPVLYQPADLAAWTEANGAVADKTLAALQQLNAGWNFVSIDADGNKAYPYRHQNVQSPTLKEALQLIPYKIPIILDMKALPASAEADRGYCTGA